MQTNTEKEKNPLVFLDLRIDDERVGRVVIELFANIAPKTVRNFLALCYGDCFHRKTRKRLHYRSTLFHKIVPNVFIQGGDVTHYDGSGGEGIYGGDFEAETFEVKHTEPGILSTVNNSDFLCNGSQFIITLSGCPQLDGSTVAFGKVIKGLACVQEVGSVKVIDDNPQVRCFIEDCGVLNWEEPWNYEDNDETDDHYPPDPNDLYIYRIKHTEMLDILTTIRLSGNHFFVKKDFVQAHRKYKKALRYITTFSNVISVLAKSEAEKEEKLRTFEKHKLMLLVNSSASAMKRGFYREVLQRCDEILRKEKNNPKVYFWRGRALLQLNEYEAALADQKTALKLAPRDKCIKREIDLINTQIKNYLVEEKKVFSKMFREFSTFQHEKVSSVVE